MAYSNGLSERMEELRYPNPRSPTDEPSYSGFGSPHRGGQSSFFSPFGQASVETRAGLPRRFTTDSSKFTTLSSFGLNNSQPSANQLSEAQLWEKKRQKIEAVREQKRKFEEQMKLLDLEERQLQQSSGHEIDSMSRALQRSSLNAAPVSEPTTPPEIAEGAFPSSLSKPGRFSLGLMSPPGLSGSSNRFSQSSIGISSPPTSKLLQSQPQSAKNRMSIKSMPGSRRDSEEEDQYEDELPPVRASNSNRFSMPATGLRSQNRISTFSSGSGIGNLAGSSFFNDDDDEESLKAINPVDLTSPDAKMYMQMTATAVEDGGFPTLRTDINSSGLHSSSTTMDLAVAKDSDSEGWASFTRPRPGHQSMPQNGLNMFSLQSQISSPPTEKSDFGVSSSDKKAQRHSMGVGLKSLFDQPSTPAHSLPSSRPVSLQSSYSTNDLPTIKSTNNLGTTATPPKTHAEQHFHNHNASLGRIPAGVLSNRQSRDLTAMMSPESKREEKIGQPTAQSMQQTITTPTTASNVSSLQASAPAFGPTPSASTGINGNGVYGQNNGAFANNQFFYPANAQYSGVQGGGPYGQMPAHLNGASYGQFPGYPNGNRPFEPANKATAPRRYGASEENLRFNNAPLDNFVGDLYNVCKDQHGCRYLQRKLEEKNPDTIQAIFTETCPHIAELMIDPFGNYLCQKLFEYCNKEQRTALIETAALSMVEIALNQHGTRALQKMIEFLDTPEQVQMVIRGLDREVVRLVQDLNGNHVIQKCLNRLNHEEAQFIYHAAAADCVRIGTHRHGCCVLQRCIDHANDQQRSALIAKITQDAFELVQDPFGNYVVQYILDLNEQNFTTPLCLSFCGNIASLSKQKFSSNVIEKCLRSAQPEVKRQMIEEMLRPLEMDKLLKDSFANYVVQTALDFADPETKMRLIEVIRPILPAIKQTPHGRRIASKIVAGESNGRITAPASQAPPTEPLQAFPNTRQNAGASGRRQFQIYGTNIYQGSGNGTRYNNTNGEGFDAGAFTNGYSGVNGGQPGYNNLYNQASQQAAAVVQQPTYTSYAGSQPGPGYF